MEIITGSSDNNSSRHESSSFDRVQRRSNESQYDRKKGSGVKRQLEEKGVNFKKDQGERHTSKTDKRGPLIRSTPSSWSETSRNIKKSKNQNIRVGTCVSQTLGPLEPCPPRCGGVRYATGKKSGSRRTMEMQTQQGGPVRVRKSNGRNYSSYIEEQTKSGNKNTRRRDNQQQKDQERRSEY
ncbi:uncharacterized protein TNCV_2637691 [Trichonephila clavipes]|nr:uncharacterized protein TNCV_2637691 [Trichonephila clavipes]